MRRVVGLALPAIVTGLGVVVIARGFAISDPNWPQRVGVSAALFGLALSLAAYLLGVRKGVALAGLAVCIAAIGYVEWISPGGAGATL